MLSDELFEAASSNGDWESAANELLRDLLALRTALAALADKHYAESTRLAYAKGDECMGPLSNAHDDFTIELRELLEGR
jgi:NTP pyrophosphatase (non-canonical NTP hydrolase)